MLLFLDYYNLSLFLGGLVAILSGAAVYFSNHRKPENIAWMFLNISTAVWSFGYFGMLTRGNAHDALISNWILHAGAILIPIFYFAFVIALTKTASKHREVFYLLVPTAVYFLLVNTSSDFVRMVLPKGPLAFAPDAGPLYIYFTVYFFATVIYALTILAENVRRAIGQDALRLKYVLFSSLFGFTGGGFVFFLTFNVQIAPYPIILFTFYPMIIAYAMLRHKLFDVKVAATEILTGAIWIALLFRILLSDNPNEQIMSGVLLFLMIIFGTLLIRSVYKEVKQREQIQKLAEELALANKGQEELIHTVSHEVKGGLAQAGAAFAAIIEDDYIGNPEAMKSMLREALRGNKEEVARLEQTLMAFNPRLGTEAYDMQEFDFKEALLETTAHLKPEADAKHLALEVRADETEKFFIKGDRAKIASRVLHNLIENAILYTPSGTITVSLSKKDGKILLEVKDSGVGITPEDNAALFTKGGRGKDAMKVNAHSTGNGLYLAKVIVEKHGGKIWAESEGAGKGATFFVELPAK
ncbi:MAG: hypothetical protein G01um101417_492 [Parcubacteria group bacterium Gr01-1014_17]|nr:MAG: hypothetical protein G01um101417_492 [Parcubacteria group bacterium Gr01-1014_17]